jgi:hypothetical protein
MILYSVTVNIDHSVHDEWVEWMKNVHIPEVMNTGMFVERRFCRLLGSEDFGGITYSIQYVCKTMEAFETYQKEFAPLLQAKHTEKYKDKFVAFRTLLEIID